MKKTTVGKILLTHPVLMAGAWGLPFGRHSNMKNEDSFLGFMHDDKNRWYFMNCIVQRCGDLFGIFCNGGLMKFERNKLVRNPNPNTTQIQSCLRQGKKCQGINEEFLRNESGLSLNIVRICIFDTWHGHKCTTGWGPLNKVNSDFSRVVGFF